MKIHRVSKPTTNDNFNNSCRIRVILGTNIAEEICHRKVVWHTTSPVYCTYLTLGNFKTCKITSSAVKEYLFELLVFYLSITFLVTRARNKCSKCCPSACTHALSCFLHSLMAAWITFCCRLFQTSMNAASAHRHCSYDIHTLSVA